MSPKKIARAATTFAGVTLLAFSLSQAAQAKTMHVAHHHHFRAAHAAAGAVDVAAAVTSPWTGPAWQGMYYGPSPWGDYDCRLPHAFDCRPVASWGH
ncbi:MAG: hypothetical protein ABSG88_15085 [Bradyrhizobium sp.]